MIKAVIYKLYYLKDDEYGVYLEIGYSTWFEAAKAKAKLVEETHDRKFVIRIEEE